MSEPITNRPKHWKPYCERKQSIFERLQDIWETIVDFPSNIWYEIRTFLDNVRRLYSWSRIIWNDRDWSDHYLLIIIRKKLVSIHQDSKTWNWVGSEQQTKILQQCINDIDVLLEYSDGDMLNCVKEEYKQFTDKYGDLTMWDVPIKDGDMYECHLAYSKCTTNEMAQQADQRMDELYKLQDERYKQIHNRFWNTIRDNHNCWWD